MATIPLRDATVLADGRWLVVRFSQPSVPASYTWPDHLLALKAGITPVLSNGAICEPMGDTLDLWNEFQVEYSIDVGASTIPAGDFAFRFIVVDGSGNLVKCSDVTSAWGSDYPRQHASIGVANTRTITISWPDITIESGQTGRIYATVQSPTLHGVEQLGLLRTGIAAGTTSITISDWTFVDSAARPALAFEWCGNYWIPDDHIVEDTDTVTLTADAGLVQDSAGNVSASIAAVPVTNLSRVDSAGSTRESISISGSGRVVYLSSTFGDNANDGTIESPVQTLPAATALITAGTGSQVLFLRGDTFTLAGNGSIKSGPADKLTPMLWDSYYHDYGQGDDPGTFPVIVAHTVNILSLLAGDLENILIRNLRFFRTPSNTSSGTMNILTTMRNFMVSNCIFDGCNLALQCESHQTQDQICFHRSTLTNSRVLLASPHRQGIFARKCQNILISESFIHDNGHTGVDGTEKDQFNQNIYLQYGSARARMHSTYSTRAAASAVQGRGGIVAYGCVFDDFTADMAGNNNSTVFRRCLSLGKNGVNAGALLGTGIARHDCSHTVFEECFAGQIDLTNPSGAAWGYQSGSAYDGIAAHRKKYAILRHCTVLDNTRNVHLSGKSLLPTRGMEIYKNLFLATVASQPVTMIFVLSTIDGPTWETVSLDRNIYLAPTNNFFQVRISGTTTSYTLAQMQSIFGKEPNSRKLTTAPEFADRNRNLGSWFTHNGHVGGREGFFTYMVDAPEVGWSELRSAYACWQYLRNGFTPSGLEEVPGGDGLAFYGMADYSEEHPEEPPPPPPPPPGEPAAQSQQLAASGSLFVGYATLGETLVAPVLITSDRGEVVVVDPPAVRVYGPGGALPAASTDAELLSSGTITGASSTTPIVVTSPGHGLVAGVFIQVSGVEGNVTANGFYRVVDVTEDGFTLDGSSGSGEYTTGGEWYVSGMYSYEIDVSVENGFARGETYMAVIEYEVEEAPVAKAQTFIVV